MRTPQLAGRDIHVWPVHLVAPEDATSSLCSLLSADERSRAARIQHAETLQAFTLCRGVLRLLLGNYLGVDPASLEFTYTAFGKPVLVTAGNVSFNVSHSGTLALLAFANGLEIGIDIERMTAIEIETLAKRFFSGEECEELIALPPAERQRAFFRCWTRKEAYIKAIGTGMSTDLFSFRVSLRPGEPARLLHISKEAGKAHGWTLHDVSCGSDYEAALAYEDAERPLILYPETSAGELLQRFTGLSVT